MENNTLTAPKAPLPIGAKGIELESFEALWRFAQCVAASPFAPRGMEKAEAIVPAIQLGLELGLTPMSALQNVAVINGRPGIYGDAALALVRASGRCESYSQKIEGEGDNRAATVISKRDDQEEAITSVFSVTDAKKAGLWGKQGPWSQYPDRMLLFRARGFNLRDNFGDILKGLQTLEEITDYMKPVPGRTLAASEGIQFGPAGIEAGITEEEQRIGVAAVQAEKARRKRRTKAEMLASAEQKQPENAVSGAESEEKAPEPAQNEEKKVSAAPPRATPLEGLRNLIAASPVSEEQLVRHLVISMRMEPHQKLEDIPDDEIAKINSEFMTIAAEILDVEKEINQDKAPF